MPYDARLDGLMSPLRGTVSDFAQRALRDFVCTVLPDQSNGTAEAHRRAVTIRLAGWPAPVRSRGLASTDAELLAAMRRHWTLAGGSSTRMLQLLRSRCGLACEQRRFRRLFADAAVGAE
jgi:hypothetical protein